MCHQSASHPCSHPQGPLHPCTLCSWHSASIHTQSPVNSQAQSAQSSNSPVQSILHPAKRKTSPPTHPRSTASLPPHPPSKRPSVTGNDSPQCTGGHPRHPGLTGLQDSATHLERGNASRSARLQVCSRLEETDEFTYRVP